MKRNTLIIILCCSIIAFSGCSILQFSNLLNCKFAMAGVRNVTWAGINFSNVNSLQDLSITNMTKALDAIKRMDFTITCDVNVKTENNTNRMARLIGYDYELFLNGQPNAIAKGSSRDREYIIPANSTVEIPIPVSMDLVSVVKNREVGSIIQCIRDIQGKGNGTSSDVTVKFTPYLSLGRAPIHLSPITLTKTFQSSEKMSKREKKQTSNTAKSKR
ncbi:MAG: LEA type 2 family protein [Bacteroidales bacterium]|nr:LEA type 2 family protein [Bacteroidales bacterium]